jgi:hypothetical protein
MDAVEMNALDVLVARSALPEGLAAEFAASVPAVLCHNQQACTDPQVVEALFDPALFTELAVSTSGAGAQRFVELLTELDPAAAAPVLRGLACRPRNRRWPTSCLDAVLEWMEPSVTARPFTFRDEFTALAAAPWLSLSQRLAVARLRGALGGRGDGTADRWRVRRTSGRTDACPGPLVAGSDVGGVQGVGDEPAAGRPARRRPRAVGRGSPRAERRRFVT